MDERIEFIEKTSARWVARHTVETPAGNLSETLVYPCDNPPTTTEKFIKNIYQLTFICIIFASVKVRKQIRRRGDSNADRNSG